MINAFVVNQTSANALEVSHRFSLKSQFDLVKAIDYTVTTYSYAPQENTFKNSHIIHVISLDNRHIEVVFWVTFELRIFDHGLIMLYGLSKKS